MGFFPMMASFMPCAGWLEEGRIAYAFGFAGHGVAITNMVAMAMRDVILERDGATVLIDSVSLPFMGGSVIDFVDDLIGQSFQIKNPNATASCGCGTSFSI